MTESLMSGQGLERSDVYGGGGGFSGTGTIGSANVTAESDGEPDDYSEDQKLQSPLGPDESSNTAKDCYSDTPLCGTDWEGEETTLRLHPTSPGNGNGYKRSPSRGMLRAVSSITITDIEAFEESLSTLRGNILHVPLIDVRTNTNTRKLSPVPASTSTETPSVWSPSYMGSTNQKPRRGAGKSRRRREQRGECWYSDDDILDDKGSTEQQPFPGGEDTVSMASLIRRKSIDLLPNVPRRAPSTQDLADGEVKAAHKTSIDEDSEMKRLIHTLHNELYLSGPKTPKLPKTRTQDSNTNNANAHFRGSSPFETFTTFPPRRHVGGELAVDRFDRFNSDMDPFNNLLPRHQSLDGMLYPAKGIAPRTSLGVVESVGGVHITKLTGDDESESEPESSSHFKVREFVVSLDYLEDNKTRGDMPRRRRSFDALPTPPRRFLDELEAEDGDETSVRRRSFDDLGNVRRKPVENERQSGIFSTQDNASCLDRSHRSQQPNNMSPNVLDNSHRSQQLGYSLDQSTRSQQGFTPLDRSHRSQSNGSAEMNEEDRSIRRTSHDILPAIPRRRLASESSTSSSGSDLSPLPLRMDDDLVQRNAADMVPNAPRRTDSGIGSKASSLSIGDYHLDEMTVSSSSAVKDPPVPPQKPSLHLLKNHTKNIINNIDHSQLNNSGHLRLKSCDQIPSLPTRDPSLTAFDLFDIGSDDQGNHADTEDNGVEPDYESIDETTTTTSITTTDKSLSVPIKDSSTTRYLHERIMHRNFVESSILEGGTSEELSPATTTSKYNPSNMNQEEEEEDGDDEGDHDDHDDEDDTETTSVEHHEDKESETTSLKRNRASRRRKKKSSFLLRLFASRN